MRHLGNAFAAIVQRHPTRGAPSDEALAPPYPFAIRLIHVLGKRMAPALFVHAWYAGVLSEPPRHLRLTLGRFRYRIDHATAVSQSRGPIRCFASSRYAGFKSI